MTLVITIGFLRFTVCYCTWPLGRTQDFQAYLRDPPIPGTSTWRASPPCLLCATLALWCCLLLLACPQPLPCLSTLFNAPFSAGSLAHPGRVPTGSTKAGGIWAEWIRQTNNYSRDVPEFQLAVCFAAVCLCTTSLDWKTLPLGLNPGCHQSPAHACFFTMLRMFLLQHWQFPTCVIPPVCAPPYQLFEDHILCVLQLCDPSTTLVCCI